MRDKEIEALKTEIAELKQTIANMRSTYYIFKSMIELHEKDHGKVEGINL